MFISKLEKYIRYAITAISIVLLVACGSDDPSTDTEETPGAGAGSDTTMSINASNESVIATDVTAGVVATDNVAMAIEMLAGANPIDGTGFGSNFPGLGGTSSMIGSCGGDRVIEPGIGSLSIVFNNYCIDVASMGEITVNGSLTMSLSSAGSSISSMDLMLSINAEVYAVVIDIAVDPSATPPIQINTLTYTGPDGVEHDIADLQTVASGGMGTLNYEDIGNVNVSVIQTLEYNCPDAKPSAGEVSALAADGSSMNISFTSCTGFTVTRDGISTDYSWPTVSMIAAGML